MRYWKLLFITVMVSSLVFAQDRAVITPDGEAIMIQKGQSSFQVIKEYLAKKGVSGEGASLVQCVNKALTGVVDATVGVNFGFFHGEVLLQRMVSPVDGVIESVYFKTWVANNTPDSSCAIRIFESNITDANPGPPGTALWGYYVNTNDPDVGRTPYKDEATDTVFRIASNDSASPYFDPNGIELWGLGGFTTTWHRLSVNGIAMIDLGYEPPVTTGMPFNVNIRLPAAHIEMQGRTEHGGINASALNFLKYYHHERFAAGDSSQGWWRRAFDMIVWAVVRVQGNLPPTVTSATVLNHTISTAARPVNLTAFDCNPGAPADTGVTAASVWYRVDGGAYVEVPLVFGPSGWSGEIPGQAGGSVVDYYYTVRDNLLATTTTGVTQYKVVQLNRAGYTTTAPYSHVFEDITATGGTEIPETDWFFPPGSTADEPSDDGAWGPVDLGGGFAFFDSVGRYAWIGVNGAVAVSGSAADTIHVNSGGFFTTIRIPGTPGPGLDLRNWALGFWNDLLVVPGYPTFPGHGSVWYKVDVLKTTFQWNKVGNFNDLADTTTTFQIILDRSDSSVIFYYNDVGTTGLELTAEIGLQTDPTNQWLLLNDFGYPVETQAANASAIKTRKTAPTGVRPGGDRIPGGFALYANYPNPFNPSTEIQYDLPTRSKVELAIYNILGEKVADLVNGEQGAGSYVATWDGRNLQGHTVASGVYLYRLKAGDFLQTRKMLLMK